jgi:hypothetical protein
MEKFTDMGEYHDPKLRLERTDIAQADFDAHKTEEVDPVFVDVVVKQLSNELAPAIKLNPTMSVNEIKIQAMHRFIDLLEKKLLTQREADRCYQRFVQMVHFYYGS